MAPTAITLVIYGFLATFPGLSAQGKDPAVVKAEMVEKCKRRHQISRASEVTKRTVKARESWASDYEVIEKFQSCQWPPPGYADPDGYSEITYSESKGPGECEADGTSRADRFKTSCKRLKLAYTFASQGAQERLEPFVAEVGSVVEVGGHKYDNRTGPLDFYPGRNELVVLASTTASEKTCQI